MGILTDIYNTVAKFFRSQELQTGEDASKSVAQNRLKLVLMQDRTNLTPKVLEQMRGEMIDLLSKYLEMDKELLELNFEQEGDQVALMLSIPVIRAKDEDEIEAALASSENNDDENEENDKEEDSTEEEIVSEETVKPKKRRSRKVTTPEELESTNIEENQAENVENSSEDSTEQNEQNNEAICENIEG